jgi:hypothetical protein
MDSHAIEMAELSLKMAESATGQERRILLGLAKRWLAKAPRVRENQWLALQLQTLEHTH